MNQFQQNQGGFRRGVDRDDVAGGDTRPATHSTFSTEHQNVYSPAGTTLAGSLLWSPGASPIERRSLAEFGRWNARHGN
jgi:hypothetical protein